MYSPFVTIEDANRLYKEQITDLTAKYGRFRVPHEEMDRASAILRARCVLAIHQNEVDKIGELRRYGFSDTIINLFDLEPVAPELLLNRNDKHKIADQFCRENVGAQITPQQLADAVGWSYSTAIGYINDNVTVFIKVKKGLYEIRDPKAEREREKQRGLDS